MLGMAISAYTPTGLPAGPDEAGELVCEKVFPCMPVGFWPLEGFGAREEEVRSARERFREAYFPEMPVGGGGSEEKGERGVWCEFSFFGCSRCLWS